MLRALADAIALDHYQSDRSQLARGEALTTTRPVGYSTGACSIGGDLRERGIDPEAVNADRIEDLVSERYQDLVRDRSSKRR